MTKLTLKLSREMWDDMSPEVRAYWQNRCIVIVNNFYYGGT